MQDLAAYLQDAITDKMPLEEMVGVFERMCRIPVENDMILFETGTFSFTGEPLFYFSLVRQFPNEEEEFFQVELKVLYQPTEGNKPFHAAVWNESLNEDIFDYIRRSPAFAYAKDHEYLKVEIDMFET